MLSILARGTLHERRGPEKTDAQGGFEWRAPNDTPGEGRARLRLYHLWQSAPEAESPKRVSRPQASENPVSDMRLPLSHSEYVLHGGRPTVKNGYDGLGVERKPLRSAGVVRSCWICCLLEQPGRVYGPDCSSLLIGWTILARFVERKRGKTPHRAPLSHDAKSAI